MRKRGFYIRNVTEMAAKGWEGRSRVKDSEKWLLSARWWLHGKAGWRLTSINKKVLFFSNHLTTFRPTTLLRTAGKTRTVYVGVLLGWIVSSGHSDKARPFHFKLSHVYSSLMKSFLLPQTSWVALYWDTACSFSMWVQPGLVTILL